MEVGHSRLLKFFKESRPNKSKMAEAQEIPVIKIQKEYQSPPNVEAEVPGTHEIRETDKTHNSSDSKITGAEDNKNTSSEIKITGADFTLSPVITVTKKESTLTKGDMKLQKVTVTEDIAEEESDNGGYRVSQEVEILTQTDRKTSVKTSDRIPERNIEKMEGEEKSQDEKRSKIPTFRLKQAVEGVKRERQAQKARGEQPRRSSIPKLKDAKKVKRETSLNFTPMIEDEFDKLYEEIVVNTQKDVEEKLPSVTMEDSEKIETKFEEIIHAYDDDEHEKQTVSKVSKIPALKRKDDDGSSRLGALIGRAREKSIGTENKLKDGGFKVTASTIRTKRFSRGNSKDASSEQQIEVTETIDIRESGDNEVFVKETVKTAPAKPERSFRNISKRVVAEQKANAVEATENFEGTPAVAAENLDKKDGTLNKTKRFTRTMSRETKERNLNRELSRNLHDIRREFRNRIEDSRIDDEFKDVDHVVTIKTTEDSQETPVKTQKIVRGISKDISEDGKSINSTETVTVEELEDGGTRTITTTTTESVIIGTPVVTEKVIRNISREISSESQNNSVRGVTTIDESIDDESKKVTKETAKGIPVKTERFTRGISREMGNIKLKSSKEIVTALENQTPVENTHAIKKETMKTEQIEKEGVKVGIPVYTKVTRSFSKGKIENVQMSRTIEWKPADEVKTANYSRSVSEKVTKKELTGASKWKYVAPNAINELTDVNGNPIEQNVLKSTQNQTLKDPLLESRIKDTVKDIANKITTKKVTEYKSEEQVTNVEKTTFTLSSNVDLTIDRGLKVSREIGTQMSIDGKPVDRNFKFVKEFGTQMSVEGKALESPFDRDFKLAKERHLENKTTSPTIDGNFNASKEFGTQMSTVERTIVSTIDGESKTSREFGTQMSVVGRIVDRDFKVSKEIGTQMSLESPKPIPENNFDRVGEENAVIDMRDKEYSNSSTLRPDSEFGEVTILKGNVSRLKDKIARETAAMSKKEPVEELPKKKSVFSKIAIFESLEPKESDTVIELPKRRIKCKYVPPNFNRTNSADRPKIVDEILKEPTQTEPSGDTDKVEIGVYYDEVTYYTTEPAVVQNVTDINQMTTEIEEVTSAYQQQDTNRDWESAKILPSTIDFKAEKSKIEFASTTNDITQMQREHSVIEMPTIFPAKINYEADIGKTKPGKINLNIWSTQVEINKNSVDKIDVFKEESLNEIAQSLPGKIDFKAYESQVPVSVVLPGIIDFKSEESQIEDIIMLPAQVSLDSDEFSQAIVEIVDSKTDVGLNGVNDNLPGTIPSHLVSDLTPPPEKNNVETYEVQTEITTTLPSKIEVESNQTEISKTLTAFGYTSVQNPNEHRNLKTETSQKEVGGKPKPGKINFSLWQSQVESNKTLVGKPGIKKSKDAEMAKALSGRVNFSNKSVRVTETVQGNNVFNGKEYKAVITKNTTDQHGLSASAVDEIESDFVVSNVDTAKPLLDFVDSSNNGTQVSSNRTFQEAVNFSNASSQAEVATILPGTIEFSSSTNQTEEPRISVGKINFETEFVTTESKAEISETLQDSTYFSSTDYQTESTTTFSRQNTVEKVGKINLKAWQHDVEVNKTLVDKTDVVKSEHLEEIANTLPGKIDFITYESHVGEPKTFQAPINFNTEENKVQITELEVDPEADEIGVEDAKILPAAIELDPFKHTPRFNPLPMLMRLNSQENKVVGNESAQGAIDLKVDVYKVDIPIDSNPEETLSDPDLVDEDPAVEVKSDKDAIIGSIKRKLYFITNKSSVQNSTTTPMNTPVPVETDDHFNYDKKVDELLKKTYSLNDIDHNINEAKMDYSVASTWADNASYEIVPETIEESYSYNVTDNNNFTEENEPSHDTNTVQNNQSRAWEQQEVDDFIISPPSNYKEYFDNVDVTNENRFNFDVPKVENALTRSAYGADDFKTSTEELKRAKSLAELDLGDVVHGQVKRIVGRIKSVDFSRRESVKTEISIKEMPKKLSVLEKIALFEGKTARSRYESTTFKPTTTKKSMTPVISEEVYLKKIDELINGKTKYGRLEDMLYLPLSDGAEIPVLALGTALMDPRLLPHLIGAAIDMGYRAIDTAYIYGNEKEIGQAIKAKIDDGTVKREDLFIISKLWSTFHRTDLVEVACKASLENLGLDYFDLYLIHNPMSFKEGSDPIPKIATVLQYSQYDYLNAWFGMEGLVTKGLVKSIGVSNFNSLQIQRILDKGRLKPVINQVECHPYLSQQRLHVFCAERNITLSCFGVLGSKGTPAEYKNSTTPVIEDALVKVMASGLNVTPAQLLIRYQIESGHNVVVKASSAAHLWDNLQALTFTLDQPQVDALTALNKNKRTYAFKGMGDTHKNYPFLAPY